MKGVAGIRWSDSVRQNIHIETHYDENVIDVYKNSLSSLVGNTLSTLEHIESSPSQIKAVVDYDFGIERPLEEIMKIRNYGKAFRYLLNTMEGRTLEDFSRIDLLLKLHSITAKDELCSAGKLRDRQVCIYGCSFIPPPPKALFKHLSGGLLELYESWTNKEATPFEYAFGTFFFLSRLQPFMDCNKRTASLYMNGLLLSLNLPPFVLSIPRVDFLDTMTAFYESGDCTKLMETFFQNYRRQQHIPPPLFDRNSMPHQ